MTLRRPYLPSLSPSFLPSSLSLLTFTLSLFFPSPSFPISPLHLFSLPCSSSSITLSPFLSVSPSFPIPPSLPLLSFLPSFPLPLSSSPFCYVSSYLSSSSLIYVPLSFSLFFPRFFFFFKILLHYESKLKVTEMTSRFQDPLWSPLLMPTLSTLLTGCPDPVSLCHFAT